jgi:hypothetical protein
VKSLVDEEVEGEILLVDEFEVTGGVGLVDAKGLGVEGSEGVDCVAHGDELIRSARSAVGRVEEEGGAALVAFVREAETRAGRAGERELRGKITYVYRHPMFPPLSMNGMTP